MRKEALTVLEVAEGSWWDRGRQAAIQAVLKKSCYKKVLDYGAGFGAEFSFLKKYGQEVYAYEPDTSLHEALEKRGYNRIFTSADEALSHQYDLIALLDVLEHIEDDGAAAARLHTALTTGGLLMVTVPAYQWLWSAHDDANLHFRRYTTYSLKKVLKQAGFDINYLGYWNMMLLLPLSVIRFLGGTGKSGLEVSPFIDSVVLFWLRIEAFFIKYIPLPFGVSVVALAKKVR